MVYLSVEILVNTGWLIFVVGKLEVLYKQEWVLVVLWDLIEDTGPP